MIAYSHLDGFPLSNIAALTENEIISATAIIYSFTNNNKRVNDRYLNCIINMCEEIIKVKKGT